MFKSYFKFLILIAVLSLIVSCSDRNKKSSIKFSADSTGIIIKDFDAATLLQVKNTYQNHSDQLIAVVLLPDEEDSVQDQSLIPGQVSLKGDSLIFTPSFPFIKGKTYLVESYIDTKFANADKLISGNIKQRLQPHRQTLKR